MKVLKKAKILPCECQYCHSVFQPKWKDVVKGGARLIKEVVCCPMCKGKNYVNFEKSEGADDEKKS